MTDYFNLVVLKPSVAYAAKQGGGTIASIYEIQLLEPGALAIFTAENKLVTAATLAADLVGVQQFYMVTGAAEAGTAGVKTVNIDRDSFHQLKTAFVAAVTQISAVGREVATTGTGEMNLPAVLTPGETALLTITDTSSGAFQANRNYRYEVTIANGETEETLVDKLIAAVNADANRIVNATKVSDSPDFGIVLTAINNTITFVTNGAGVIENSTITEFGSASPSVSPNVGSGTLASLTDLERIADIARGRSQSGGQERLWWKQPSELATFGGTNFVTYNYMWQAEHFNGINVVPTFVNQVMVAIADGDANVSVFDTIIAILLQAPTTSAGASPEGEFSD